MASDRILEDSDRVLCWRVSNRPGLVFLTEHSARAYNRRTGWKRVLPREYALDAALERCRELGLSPAPQRKCRQSRPDRAVSDIERMMDEP